MESGNEAISCPPFHALAMYMYYTNKYVPRAVRNILWYSLLNSDSVMMVPLKGEEHLGTRTHRVSAVCNSLVVSSSRSAG